MKHYILFSLLFLNIFCSAQSVSVIATNGGSVTLSPEGVTRDTKPAATRAVAKPITKKETKTKAKEIVELANYKFDSLTLFEVRHIRNNLAYIAYDENADNADDKAFDDLRKFVKANKKNENTTNTVSLTVSRKIAEQIISQLEYNSFNHINFNDRQELRQEYNRLLKIIDLKEKLLRQIQTAEKNANVLPQQSIIRR